MPFDNCILTENFSGSPCRNCDFMAQAGTGQGLRRLWNWYTNEDGCWYLRVLVCYSRPWKYSGKADWGQSNLNLDVPWWLECCYDLIHWRRNMWAFDWSNLLINKCASPVYISNCCWNWWKSKYSVAIEVANSLLAKKIVPATQRRDFIIHTPSTPMSTPVGCYWINSKQALAVGGATWSPFECLCQVKLRLK